eukprot:TRINITY_DN2764_c0_g1_i2.p1 TRINITY_DN2764_c0_g1~~TRINITY_DN2764_c0_g1_i2.p1  ORF type:complete len:662 (-),score=176.39 TRINITY_DN2764_c0_g1_i2:144-2129(-)
MTSMLEDYFQWRFNMEAVANNIATVLSYKKTLAGGALAVGTALMLKKKKPSSGSRGSSKKRRHNGKIDAQFVKNLKKILSTGMPSIWSREYLDALLLAAALLGRTWLSLLIARFFGRSINLFVEKRFEELRDIVPHFVLLSFSAATLNSSLHYLRDKFSLDVREKVTMKVHELYMSKMNYYVSNKVGNHKLENADQLIAEDIQKFSETLSEVFSEVLKPLVDMVVFTVALQRIQGTFGPATLYSWFAIASVITAGVLPAYGRMAVRRQELEGSYRSMHGRLIENSEMVAFMGGEVPEKRLIDRFFKSIKDYVRGTHYRLFVSNSVIGYVNKYAASAIGFALVVLPVLWPEGTMHNATSSEISGFYVESSRLMVNLAEAILALFEVSKLIGRLSGLSARVTRLITTLEETEDLNLPSDPENPPLFVEGDHLAFKNVTLYKPDGGLLLKDLSFEVPRGTRVIITGENGVGKSSLFRVLRGLWPLSSGTITTPDRTSVKTFYFLSQANFVPIGSLREIVIYPHTLADMKEEARTDDDILEALRFAHLENLKVNGVRPSPDTVLDWQVDLSPGQKQRMAFARLFYHHPQYAVLDDCTNGVAPDIEQDLYNRLRLMNVTALSISHKNELRPLHDYELRYDSKGSYTWIDLKDLHADAEEVKEADEQ